MCARPLAFPSPVRATCSKPLCRSPSSSDYISLGEVSSSHHSPWRDHHTAQTHPGACDPFISESQWLEPWLTSGTDLQLSLGSPLWVSRALAPFPIHPSLGLTWEAPSPPSSHHEIDRRKQLILALFSVQTLIRAR